jgi:hypothetical protein
MDIELLKQPHTFREGDNVLVNLRDTPNITYEGTIYKISSLPLNKHITPYKSIYVDYFYIAFSPTTYNRLLSRGSEIIYNHNQAILGNVHRNSNGEIDELFIQDDWFTHTEKKINITPINAMLVWRVAFHIARNPGST